MNQLAALMTSTRADWCTPLVVLERVRQVGPIVLDPCASRGAIVRAAVEYHEGDDGLTKSWALGGLVYVNPPYGRPISRWTWKMREEGERGVELVALLPARVDTEWWQEDVAPSAESICFWRGRLTFLGAEQGAPFPSAVVYWGERVRRFVRAFAGAGWIVGGRYA